MARRRPNPSDEEGDRLGATAIVGLGVIAGGVLGFLTYSPCDGKRVLCGPGWGAARGVAVGAASSAVVGAGLTMAPGLARMGMLTAVRGLGLAGLVVLGGALRSATAKSAPPPQITPGSAP